MIYGRSSLSHKDITYQQNIEEIEGRLKGILQSGRSAIYDSTNLREEHRTNFSNLATSVGAEPVVVYLAVSPEVAKERRAQSLVDGTHHKVSDENFNNALERLEPPTEGVIIRTENEKKEFLDKLKK
ncbi:MAG TPA: AAA family ATPase [Candidatus Paceibacterota bacterium]